MPHTDGGETSGKHRNISPRSSSPVRQNIIQIKGVFDSTLELALIGISHSTGVFIVVYTNGYTLSLISIQYSKKVLTKNGIFWHYYSHISDAMDVADCGSKGIVCVVFQMRFFGRMLNWW